MVATVNYRFGCSFIAAIGKYKLGLKFLYSLAVIQISILNMNIPVRRSRSSGDLETACPELGTAIGYFYSPVHISA